MASLNYLQSPQAPLYGSSRPQAFPGPTSLRNPLGILPSPSSIGQRPNEEVNVTVPHYLRTVPTEWTGGFQQGFPMFVNTEFRSGGPATLVGSLPMVNYYLEEGARLRHVVLHARNESERERAADILDGHRHLYGERDDVSSLMSTWRYYGVLLNMGGKTSDGVFSGSDSTDPEPVIHCVIQKRARVKNLWGDVCVGDRVYLRLTRVNAWMDGVMTPDGTIVHPAGVYPVSYYQWTPVVYPKRCQRPSHLTDEYATETGGEGALDFISPQVVKPVVTRKVTLTEAGQLEWQNCEDPSGACHIHDEWQYGGLVPMGTVLRVGATNAPVAGRGVHSVLRDQRELAALGTVELLLGVL